MAYIDETGAYGVETHTEDSHEIHHNFSVYGFIYLESLLFTRDYDALCQALPTSWEIGVRFQRVCSIKTILCRLSVKRTDNLPVAVRASSKVAFYNVQNQQLGSVLSFQMVEVTRGQEVQRTADPVLTTTEMSSLFGQQLRAKVSLKVTSCHRVGQKYDPIASLSAGIDKMFSPK